MADYKRITQLVSRSQEEQLSREKQTELEQRLAGDRLARRMRDVLVAAHKMFRSRIRSDAQLPAEVKQRLQARIEETFS